MTPKVDKQCSKAANEVNKRLGMINRNYKCRATVRNVTLIQVHCKASP